MLLREVVAIILIYLKHIVGEDIICAVNGRKSLNTVDDRFLSLSIDPAALITGININYTSLLLAQHLSTSFVRIAGPSTEFLSYSKNGDDGIGLTVTSSMWQSMNDWFRIANLTPIFAINDNEKVNGAWNPKPFYPLLDLSDKLDITCLWQLGFDSSCKTLQQYKEDLLTLKHVLDTFPSKKNVWKVVGSDISGYAYNLSNTRYFLQTLRGQVDYFMYENASLQNAENFPDMTMRTRLLPKENFKIWTTAPKSQHTVTFASALEWARQIGDAARGGYSVIFRQPRLHEFFVDTPTYWVSLLHKRLMGKKVLEIKFSQETNSDFHAYVHCTRKQNDFSKLGAITIMVVNNETSPNALALRIGSGNIKKIMIHSYILTTNHEESVNMYLNGKKLSMELLEENEKLNFPPKLRRARVTKFLSLPLPEKSIGFFVLPSARIPICINEEYNMKVLMQEIHEDQTIKFESEEDDNTFPNYQLDEPVHASNEPVNFNEIFQQIERELENDEEYYKNFQYETTTEKLASLIKDFKRETKLTKRIKPKKLLSLNLEIDNEELKSFLKDKLKARANEKQQTVTSEEIDREADRITKKVTNAILRRKPKRYVKERAKTLRDTRDINMDLVRMRADHPRPSHHKFRINENRDSLLFPKISTRRNEKTASTHKHSSHRHSQSNVHITPRFHHRAQSRAHNSRHSLLHRPHHLKEKRDSKEGLQDAFEFMGRNENDDASIPDIEDDFKRESSRNEDLWESARFERPNEFEEDIEDGLDFSLPLGHPMDYTDDDYYEIEIFSDDPFMRKKRKTRSKRDAERSNTLMEQKYHYIFGKPVDPSKIHMNPWQKEHQLKLLRQRLSRRKKLHNKIRPLPDASAQGTKIIVNSRRPKRSALELSLQARYKKYIPKTKHLKQWKPSDILKLGKGKRVQKRSVDSAENKIENMLPGIIKQTVVTADNEVPGVIPVSNIAAQTTSNVETSTVPTTNNIESEAESASNCMTNEECLNLVLGTSLDPEDLFKPGWVGKMYSKITNFLGKLQKDILQAMVN